MSLLLLLRSAVLLLLLLLEVILIVTVVVWPTPMCVRGLNGAGPGFKKQRRGASKHSPPAGGQFQTSACLLICILTKGHCTYRTYERERGKIGLRPTTTTRRNHLCIVLPVNQNMDHHRRTNIPRSCCCVTSLRAGHSINPDDWRESNKDLKCKNLHAQRGIGRQLGEATNCTKIEFCSHPLERRATVYMNECSFSYGSLLMGVQQRPARLTSEAFLPKLDRQPSSNPAQWGERERWRS